MAKFKKRLTLHKCRYCKDDFLAADVKACICEWCLRPTPCLCGCGGLATSKKHPWILGHAVRMPTKAMLAGRAKQAKAISGDNNPSRTHKVELSAGVKNYWKSLTKEQRIIRIKDNSFVKNPNRAKYKHKNGYRSTLEHKVVTVLDNNWIEYKYEKRLDFSDGTRCFPDFTFNNGLLLEVSGFAYEAWRIDFVAKIEKLTKEGHAVICVTYDEFFDELNLRVNVPVFTIRGLELWSTTASLES